MTDLERLLSRDEYIGFLKGCIIESVIAGDPGSLRIAASCLIKLGNLDAPARPPQTESTLRDIKDALERIGQAR